MSKDNPETSNPEIEAAAAAEAAEQLEVLKRQATALKLDFSPQIGFKKLATRVQEAQLSLDVDNINEGSVETSNLKVKNKDTDVEKSVVVSSRDVEKAVAKESPLKRRARLVKEANALVRIRVTCKNPTKVSWPGETYTGSNSFVGTIRKFIPFDSPDGVHVQQLLLNQMLERKCQVFRQSKDRAGNATEQGKLIPELAIEYLDPLTKDELTELARRQALAGTIGKTQ